jgi:hypothetical protein
MTGPARDRSTHPSAPIGYARMGAVLLTHPPQALELGPAKILRSSRADHPTLPARSTTAELFKRHGRSRRRRRIQAIRLGTTLMSRPNSV